MSSNNRINERIVTPGGSIYYDTTQNISSNTLSNIPISCINCLKELNVENIGPGIGLYKGKNSYYNLLFKTLLSDSNIDMSYNDTSTIFKFNSSTIDNIKYFSNKGTYGYEIYDNITDSIVYLRKLLSNSSNIILTQEDNYITINTNFSSDFGITNATNIGTTGISVYDSKKSNLLNFRSISANSNKINVLLGSNEHSVKLDVIESNLILANLSGTLYVSKITGLSSITTSGSYNDLSNIPTIYNSLSQLSDIYLNSLSNNEVLTYDSSLLKWTNKDIPILTYFNNINVNSDIISASIEADTIKLTSGSNITITPNTHNKLMKFSLSETGVLANTYSNNNIKINEYGRIEYIYSNNGLLDPTITYGDIIYRNSSNVISRLGIGSLNKSLTVSANVPLWNNQSVISVNSLNNNINLLLDNFPNVQLSSASNTQLLSYDSSLNKWKNIDSGTVNSVQVSSDGTINISGNIITYSGNYTVSLKQISTLSTGKYNSANISVDIYGRITSINSTNPFIDPTTSIGDLIYRNSSNITDKLSIGSVSQVLTVNNRTLKWTDQTSHGLGSINELYDVVDLGIYNLNNTAISNLQTNQILTYNGSNWVNTNNNSGTVTSFGLIGQNGLTISNNPITSSGNIIVGINSSGAIAGSYSYSSVSVDRYGRITNINNGPDPASTGLPLIISSLYNSNIITSSTTDGECLIGSTNSYINKPNTDFIIGRNGIMFSDTIKNYHGILTSTISSTNGNHSGSVATLLLSSDSASIQGATSVSGWYTIISSSSNSYIMGASRYNSIISSDNCYIYSNRMANTILASKAVRSNDYNTLILGYGTTSTGSTKNRKIQLYSRTGDTRISGTLTSSYTFTDYAEYFPNLTGIEIPIGILVSIVYTNDGYGVIPSTGDDILGVISATAGIVLGDTPFTWSGRYELGDHGERLYDSSGDLIENTNYDQNMTNIPRSDRPDEWSLVGLLGQVYINIDSTVTSSNLWLKSNNGIGTKSDSKTNVRVMKITKPYDEKVGYGIAFCMLK